MKVAAVAATVAFMASTAYADGVSISNEVNGEYNLDSEVMTLTWTPEAGYTYAGVDFTLGTDIAVYNDEVVLGDVKPTLDFGASYMVNASLEVYGEVSYNLETESRGDVVVGATFSF
jgi:outer membrane cobalamin receptor